MVVQMVGRLRKTKSFTLHLVCILQQFLHFLLLQPWMFRLYTYDDRVPRAGWYVSAEISWAYFPVFQPCLRYTLFLIHPLAVVQTWSEVPISRPSPASWAYSYMQKCCHPPEGIQYLSNCFRWSFKLLYDVVHIESMVVCGPSHAKLRVPVAEVCFEPIDTCLCYFI